MILLAKPMSKAWTVQDQQMPCQNKVPMSTISQTPHFIRFTGKKFHESSFVSYSYILKFYNFQETTFENAKNYLPSKTHITFITFLLASNWILENVLYMICYTIN